jgi:hypothetical protein
MLRSIKQIYGDKLGASDGEIGCVKDFYFDDENWVVRYLVADTGSWIPGRLVLISPHALIPLDQGGKVLPVNLTRQQIENSPSIESHQLVSRQYEQEYYRYYGWPHYRQNEGLSGMSSSPALASPKLQSREPATENDRTHERDCHLRSTKAVTGYLIQTTDEIVGSTTDFAMDDKTWAIRHLIINTGNRFSGKKKLISPDQVLRLSREESKVFVNLTREAVLQSPDFDPASLISNSTLRQPGREPSAIVKSGLPYHPQAWPGAADL